MSVFTIPDELAGEPDSLRDFAKKYQRISDALKAAASELANLANVDTTVSEAVDQVRTKARGAQADTLLVSEHYGTAAQTYATYATKLSEAQLRANQARAAIAALKGSADRATQTRDAAVDQAKFALPSQQMADELKQANANFAHYEGEYAAEMQRYNHAVSDKAAAVAEAISRLEDAEKASKLSDTWYQAVAAKARDVYDWAKKNLTPWLKAIRALAKVIASIIDVIAMFVSVVNPVVGRAIAGISLALNALALLCSLTLYALGEGSIADVIVDTIGLAVSALGVLLPGAGKLVGKSLTSAVTNKFVGDLTKDAAKSFVVNVVGTAVEAIPGSAATSPDATADVTSGSWKAEAAAPITSPQDAAGAALEDVVSAIPGADVVFGVDDTWKTLTGTGS